ncbi:MAG: DUF1015 domain-containing protein, partial [Candidatus Izemoplasmatales bacterium]|nr:DUF1015 domain-containing protein [Candidatus Izemoplasmatales bacterium]
MVYPSTIKAPNILLPKSGVDMTRFCVIACDQFTSQVDYWKRLKELIQDSPSTYHMIFPEAYLPLVDKASYILQINKNIQTYLQNNILVEQGECFILVERSTPYTKKRLGLMISVDLDAYTYEKGLRTPIRATEATILDRIPPRLQIREHAPIELPHTLLLIDDPDKTVIEALYKKRNSFEKIYDFELNSGGGHLKGYKICDTDPVIKALYALTKGNPLDLLFVVGDGNHSLATAKAHWEIIKKGLSKEEQIHHPARYSLVEVENLYDDGLTFEAIHRIVFHAGDDFIPGLKSCVKGEDLSYLYSKEHGQEYYPIPHSGPMTYKLIQDYIDTYIQNNPATKVDYIHGSDHLIEVADHHGGIAIHMPALTKSD